jgi:hypothetical protein
MRSKTPAQTGRTSPLGIPGQEALPAERMVFTEANLASRWGMSPKTLQRWLTEGRGPHYLKLGKRVTSRSMQSRRTRTSFSTSQHHNVSQAKERKMNHLQLHQAALPDLSANQISRLPKDQLAQFSHAVQELHDWTIQMRGRINRGLEQRYDEQIRQANSFGEEESARLRIDDVDLQIDVSQPKEIVWDQEHLIR